MCPFLDQGDPRCAAHLTMQNLANAFEHCADHFASCPVFQDMLVDRIQLVEQTPNPSPAHAVAAA